MVRAMGGAVWGMFSVFAFLAYELSRCWAWSLLDSGLRRNDDQVRKPSPLVIPAQAGIQLQQRLVKVAPFGIFAFNQP